jgi:hypothetical protein
MTQAKRDRVCSVIAVVVLAFAMFAYLDTVKRLEAAYYRTQSEMFEARRAVADATRDGRWPTPYESAQRLRDVTTLAYSTPWYRWLWPKRPSPGITVTKRIRIYGPA